ncbi:MAG: hypothetical protein DRO09_03130 [Thermoprotei archaeon]|nr:MAG: hypothetical protein DRO09_03130 [Thermoprotei archaeon]
MLVRGGSSGGSKKVLHKALADKLILGESLTGLLRAMTYGSSYCTIVDFWEGGSTLYGWSLNGRCIDRFPVFIGSPDCLEVLKGKPLQLRFDVEFQGSVKGYLEKVNDRYQRSWIKDLEKRMYTSQNGFCSVFRELQKGVKARRVYGEVSSIYVDKKLVYVSWLGAIGYRNLVNTLPLNYFLSKARLTEFKGDEAFKDYLSRATFSYKSLYVLMMIMEGGKLSEAKVYNIGKKGFYLATVVLLPGWKIYPWLGNKLVIYAIAPLDLGSLRAEISNRLLVEVKRAGINIKNVLVFREYFERYGVLGSEDLSYVEERLREYGITLSGRLGTWKEKSVCEIVNEFKPYLRSNGSTTKA